MLQQKESYCSEPLICDSCGSQFGKKRDIIRHFKPKCCENIDSKPKKISTKRPRRKNKSQDYEEILVDDGQKLNGDIRKKFKESSECPECKTSFSSRKNLYKHLKLIHQILDPDVQIEEHKPKIGHRCSICEKVFSLRKNLYQHLRKVHGKTNVGRKSSSYSESIKLICDACGVGFGEKKSLMRHLRTKHLVKLGREKKTVAVCVHCSSTFAHKKSLYKHERKFHGAEYKKILKDVSVSKENHKKHKEIRKNPGCVEDYACLKEILPDHYDYKLTQFGWLKEEEQNCDNGSSNWFKAKLNFTCQSKEDVKQWTEAYEMQNKLCLRVLSFPRPRTPGVLYKGRFRCHHNTMPKKGAKPNAKHTACSAVLSITLLQIPAQQHNCENSEPSLKALIFMKNTHNHAVGDPASLKYRKPIRQVKEKFLKFFQEKKTVPQALAAHRADLQAEYDAERFSYVVKDRAFMPDARWAYGLYYSYYKKKNCDSAKESSLGEKPLAESSIIATDQTNSSSLPDQSIQTSRHKTLTEKLNDIFQQIIQRCESSSDYFQSSVQNFISSYENNCQTNAQLSNALNFFAKYDTTSVQTKNKLPYVKTVVNPPEVANFSLVDDTTILASSSSTTNIISPIFKYATFSSTCSRTIRQPQTTPVPRTAVLTREKDIILPQSNTFTVHTAASSNSTDIFETRPVYAIETTDKYDDCILYPIENRQNITNCWMSTDYSMF